MKKLLLAAMAAASLAACATGSGTSTDVVTGTYQAGQTGATALTFLAGWSTTHPLPSKVCVAVRTAANGYLGLEATVSDPAFKTNDAATNALNLLENEMSTVLQAAIDLGLSFLAPAPPKLGPDGEPTAAEWAAQVSSITASVAKINCV